MTFWTYSKSSCCFNPGVRHRFHTGHVSTSNDFRPLVQVGKLQTDLVQVPLGCTEIIFCRENAQIYGCNFDNMLNLDTIYTFSIWFLYYVYIYICIFIHHMSTTSMTLSSLGTTCPTFCPRWGRLSGIAWEKSMDRSWGSSTTWWISLKIRQFEKGNSDLEKTPWIF